MPRVCRAWSRSATSTISNASPRSTSPSRRTRSVTEGTIASTASSTRPCTASPAPKIKAPRPSSASRPRRPDDTFGFAGAYGKISNDVSTSDIVAGAAPLVRDYQALVELTYQASIVPGFTVQPDFQYIFHPGAHGVAGQDGLPLRDAAVFGARFSIHY